MCGTGKRVSRENTRYAQELTRKISLWKTISFAKRRGEGEFAGEIQEERYCKFSVSRLSGKRGDMRRDWGRHTSGEEAEQGSVWCGLTAGRTACGGIGSDGFVAAGPRFAQSFDSLRGREQWRGLNIGYSSATGEGHGNCRCGNGVWHFGDGQNIKGAEREERRMDLAA